MSRRAIVGLALLGALVVGVFSLPSGSEPTPAATSAASVSGTPDSCLPCHAEVVAEWRDSMHRQAFIDPQVRAPDQSDNFRRTECLPCHASSPVFEYGIEPGTRVVARSERRQDGVDCLSCHGLPGGGMAASRSGLTAVCRPSWREELSLDALCAPCHDQHNTHDEWRASPAYERNETCIDCHMPRVAREGSEAGAPRAGRSHRFLGGRDKEFAMTAFELEHRLDEASRELVVTLVNTFEGHNLPTDSRNRALDLVVTMLDAPGAELLPADLSDRHPGGETGTARRRFRNPYRSSGDPNTQLPAGESAELRVPFMDGAVRARIELFYKMEPWIPDAEARWSHRVEVELP